MDKVQRAGAKLEQAVEESGSKAPPAIEGVTRVQVERTRFNIKDYLWSGTLGLVGFIGQALVVFFVTYFLVASGDSFRRKMVKIAGPTFGGVLAWGWLWGIWGLLLGVPLLMAVKAVCDRIDDLKPIGELLGA